MTKITKNIIVFYHESCLDGFASAYTAHKKFHNKASYIPLSHTASDQDILASKKNKITDLKDKLVYFIDFCPGREELLKIQKVARKLVVIDHHESSREFVKSLSGSVFGEGISGAYLASRYFFPRERVPKLIKYISAGDTYNWGHQKFEREILAYVRTIDFNFKAFAEVEKELENPKKFSQILRIGKILQENYLNLVKLQLSNAKLINFDGYEIYAVNASSTFKNELGHELALKSKAKFSVIYSFEKGELKISLRGNNKVDLAKLAEKFEGGGHFNAAAIKSKDPEFIREFIEKIIANK